MAARQHKGQEMRIDEFEKQVQPKAKRSRLETYKAEIFSLKNKGYANWQIAEWLASNDLKVSAEAVRKFIKSRESSADLPVEATTPITAPPLAEERKPEPDSDELAGLDKKQRREKLADQFITPERSNPLLKRIREKNQ